MNPNELPAVSSIQDIKLDVKLDAKDKIDQAIINSLSNLNIQEVNKPIDPRLVETHHYDGKLTNTYSYLHLNRDLTADDLKTFRSVIDEIKADIKLISDNLNVDFFKVIYPLDINDKLQHKINENRSILPNAVRCLDLFISNENNAGNFDPSNQAKVELVLVKVWQLIQGEGWGLDGKLEFFLQLSDVVTSGSCPPGRTTRLLQFLA